VGFFSRDGALAPTTNKMVKTGGFEKLCKCRLALKIC